jgi:hypothetical protein
VQSGYSRCCLLSGGIQRQDLTRRVKCTADHIFVVARLGLLPNDDDDDSARLGAKTTTRLSFFFNERAENVPISLIEKKKTAD